ncbi:MAG: acetoin utilization protein AcuC [Desulfarculus sp.]|nr:acetoin utilization protein AcuC [Desulfarculus sp.]
MAQPLPSPAPAYVYSDELLKFDYGPTHPLRIWRLGLVNQLIELCGLTLPAVPITPATLDQMCIFHDRRYLETLAEMSRSEGGDHQLAYGLGAEDNPVFPGLYDWSALLTGGTLGATRLVVEDGHPVAFNIAGGMHHAMAGRASGFCYVNDAVVAIKGLLAKGLRVAYIDVDAHHGDGVQWAFYDSDQVLTISLHQHPATLFPGTGSVEEMGRGAGRGFAVNLPLWPDTDDDIYTQCFEEVVPPVIEAFEPDYIVSQLGVDTFLSDPLANLNLTTKGFGRCLKLISQMAMGRWIALGGGGYHVVNVARGWTLAWAVMRGLEDDLPRELPWDWCEHLNLPLDERWLLDPKEKIRGRMWNRAQRDAEDIVAYLKKNLFPLIGARG